jgi:hypothetical protein
MDVTIDNGQISEEYDGLCIQGKSRVGVKLTAEGKYGASIKSYTSLVDFIVYKSSEFTSDVIQTYGDVEILGSAKDSRGFTGCTDRVHLNVIPYSKPLVIPLASENAIQCYRSDGNGNRTGGSTSLWIKAKGTYYDLAGMNTCSLQWRWKLASEAWNDAKHTWSTLLDIDIPANAEYNALVPGEFAPEKAYTVQIRAIDGIKDFDIKTFDIPTRDVALHLGKGGKNVAFGTYCDYSKEYTVYSDWVGIFDKGLLGTSINYNVTDVLTFAEECTDGLTPIVVNESTNKATLPEGNYGYSVGVIHKRAADQYNVILMDYVTGKIAINVHLSGTWTGWKYITPQ